jgi:hypothetical protein
MLRVTVLPMNQGGVYCLREWTGEIEEMFKESEDKYTKNSWYGEKKMVKM